jgi:hypothetical protein
VGSTCPVSALIRHFFVLLVGLLQLGYYQPSTEPTLKRAFLTLAAFTLLATLMTAIRSSGGQANEPKPSSADNLRPESYADPDAYAVYAAVLPMIWNSEHEPKSLIFQEETEFSATESAGHLCVKGDKKFSVSWGSTLKDYASVNRVPRRLLRMFPMDKTYILVPERELNDLILKSHWEDFYTRYPEAKSYISVSSVGFNAQKTKALLTMTYSCGMLCMEGTYYLMEKQNGKWVRTSASGFTSCAWAS